MYKRLKQVEFDQAEIQARLVWAIANGWKKPDTIEGTTDKLKQMGIMTDG